LDMTWEVYFQFVAAEVGLILAAMTAFRALFVSRTARTQISPQNYPSFWVKAKSASRRLLDPRRWIHSQDTTGIQKHETTTTGFDERLPDISGAVMTGLHTFINPRRDSAESEIDPLTHSTSTKVEQDTWPFSKYASTARSQGQNASQDP
ncbi:hypothetical protein MMC07_008414, partial [Pseudocyphellaria aurata]|nr:hypothetical protein [Pseudocyphellaria aurata]